MPVTKTYPGVYIEEIPSGVHTIMGVSTSVTAFVGTAKRGPINEAVHVLNFGTFEKRFGGLSQSSEMSYAVRQFFLNGGTDAWVVRLAKDPVAAYFVMKFGPGATDNALKLIAKDKGSAGNFIEVRVDYSSRDPDTSLASNFNLTLDYVSPDNPADNVSERFENLSMNSDDKQYILDIVNGASDLVTIERVLTTAQLDAAPSGKSVSGVLDPAATTVVDPTHNEIRISVDGEDPVMVVFPDSVNNPAGFGDKMTGLCDIIKAIKKADGTLALQSCAYDAAKKQITLTSKSTGEKSSVRVLPGVTNDASGKLKLGTDNGGTEVDGMARYRPQEMPDHGSLTSGVFGNTDLNNLPGAANNNLTISIDGYGPNTIPLGTISVTGATLGEKLAAMAALITAEVRKLMLGNPAYSAFTCVADTANKKLVLTSGTRGPGSSVMVSRADEKDIADSLHLVTGSTPVTPSMITLENGHEDPFDENQAYGIYIGNHSAREGIYALDAVDLFNILCLPGIKDTGILMDASAYCKDRRAFLIVDSPYDQKPGDVIKPDKMAKIAYSTALPKTEYAAVYYPWVKIADPLKNGKLRPTAPCGLIAGLYARTDTARGVWKAPAGIEAVLVGAQDVGYNLTNLENGTLNPIGVNCIRALPVYGIVCWGARTLRGADDMTSEYKYIPIRRLALYLEESLYRGTQWVVFEPNDEPLWAQIRLNVGAFMHSLFIQGAFQGKTPREAYFVKCDSESTTQDDINRGIVNIVVGFAPLKPAEFVVIKIQQIAGNIQT